MRLKDWFKTGLQYAGAVMLGSVVYGVMMSTSGIMEENLTMTAMYMLLLGAGMGLVFNMSVYKVGLPVVISFGSTRKEAFIGMQCYRLVYMLGLLAIATVLYLLAGERGLLELADAAPIGMGVMLLLHTLGAVMGMVSTRFGKGALVALSIIAGLIISGTIAGTVIVFALFEETISGNGGLGFWIFPIASLIVYGLVAIPEYKTIYKYNVRL